MQVCPNNSTAIVIPSDCGEKFSVVGVDNPFYVSDNYAAEMVEWAGSTDGKVRIVGKDGEVEAENEDKFGIMGEEKFEMK